MSYYFKKDTDQIISDRKRRGRNRALQTERVEDHSNYVEYLGNEGQRFDKPSNPTVYNYVHDRDIIPDKINGEPQIIPTLDIDPAIVAPQFNGKFGSLTKKQSLDYLKNIQHDKRSIKVKEVPLRPLFGSLPYSRPQYTNVDRKLDNKFIADFNLSHIMTVSPPAKLFFSVENIEYLQHRIKKLTYEKYKILLDRQSDNQLMATMRGIFLQHGRFLKDRVRQQVKLLNNIVLRELLPYMWHGIESHFRYLRDISKPRPVLDYPQAQSIKGMNTVIGSAALI